MDEKADWGKTIARILGALATLAAVAGGSSWYGGQAAKPATVETVGAVSDAMAEVEDQLQKAREREAALLQRLDTLEADVKELEGVAVNANGWRHELGGIQDQTRSQWGEIGALRDRVSRVEGKLEQ